MLRLGVGWSAERLSQEYEAGGAGELTRTTIAKIERDIRHIKAGEVDGVARVFGLTADDLLDLEGPKVFLSYAEQDAGIGQEVAAWLDDHGFQPLSPGLPAADDQEPSSAGAPLIDVAQAFVALLSPNFLTSPRCRRELDLALRRERQLLAADLATHFVYVLQVTAKPELDDSGLSAHSPIVLPAASGRSRDVALNKLGGSILSGSRALDVRADPAIRVPASAEFLDRGEELERVLYALNNSSGASFWLVISPPGIGKSWLLRQLKNKAAEPASGGWMTSIVDLRPDEPAEPDGPAEAARGARDGQQDAMTVVMSFFGDQPQSAEPEDYIRRAAQKIIRDGKSRLCLLDSAELLPASTVRQLRQHLGTIYRLVQDSGREDARLAFVAASRRDEGWRGIMPSPELSFLRLAGFGPGVVRGALEGLARDSTVVRSPAELRKDAELLQRVTEGVPKLVQQGLHWIRAEQWLDIERLDKPQFFAAAIAPYIQDHLLAHDSLLPAEDGQPAKATEQLRALEEGLRVLVPYRFITLSHVNHHVKTDRSFRDALEEAGWRGEDLWQAIARTALLLPLAELWREIHPAVRRLLYRSFYPEGERAAAHASAADFTRFWADQLRDTEQVAGMVESIWHEAVKLRLTRDTAMGEKLVRYARTLSGGVRPSTAYGTDDLRNYAVQRMRNDDEFQREVADVEGLFDKLIRVVADPEAQDV